MPVCTGMHTLDRCPISGTRPRLEPNRAKHGVRFVDTVGVFEDPRAITLDDPHPGEDRHVTVGVDVLVRVLVVSWTWRDNDVRMISARRATRGETREYEEG